jgi:hypothetical protein
MVRLTPYKHSPEETEGEQPWTIHLPASLPIQPPDSEPSAEVERCEPRVDDTDGDGRRVEEGER